MTESELEELRAQLETLTRSLEDKERESSDLRVAAKEARADLED